MQFRADINGLRAIAVIAVVLFHFNSSWMPGGFAGVDVFFVISGFLMTGIIFKGIEQEKFSVFRFYVARANRIVPALSVLCLVLLSFGFFYLTPLDYEALGYYVASSIGFFSNIIYRGESGYFDAVAHEKWLLHTWSLSVEWQFYMIYPLVLVAMRKFMSIKAMKASVLLGAILGFVFCVMATYYKSPSYSYYLLPARAWEMMIGGVAYLYPLEIRENRKKLVEGVGLVLIISSYFLISEANPWPGYLAAFPVLGTFLVIQAQRNDSLVTSNAAFQRLGTWSYSIYLWHWPLAVTIYYFLLSDVFIYIGMFLSVLLGFLSWKYIEKAKLRNDFGSPFDCLKCKPAYMVLAIGLLSGFVYLESGFISLAPVEYQSLIELSTPSPYRDDCHLEEYQSPEYSCEYFGENITWATIGDSHSVEIAYALAEKLKASNVGLKHFSYSACKPSYKEAETFDECASWYNESVNYVLNDKKIRNVVLSHRFTWDLFGGDGFDYPEIRDQEVTEEVARMTKNIDELINDLAKNKDNVYVFYPIPELNRNINQLIGVSYLFGMEMDNIVGTDLSWYERRNRYMIDHFDNANYPSNVHLLRSQDAFCDEEKCFAVKDGVPLYYDDDHPSIAGAAELVGLIE
ncbi:acyltransferase family protein [Microbulbifer magnicolonia]|uniref:acyltransferase family protein n=1 Tax=Microbulbifer magnicolonia TaxID=3109744 RepID=UPI002B412DB5|nr:acyltransferase family protein [Microbulbifer sp. GG15]